MDPYSPSPLAKLMAQATLSDRLRSRRRSMNGSRRHSSITTNRTRNTAAVAAHSTIRSSPNQSFRCPSSSTYSRLANPTAMQAMPP